MNSREDNSKKKVLVALSGGVDSAVTANLLIEHGYNVEGAHMVCWNEGPYCRSDQDRADAAKVAAFLNIPFTVFDFRKEYKEEVINYFYEEYEAGRTPNPDVACNSEIKFGIFLKKALEAGYDYIATGHYAQRIFDDSSKEYKLLAGVDTNKDQSYFLYKLTGKELSHVLFPLGELAKPQVREIAAQKGLPNATKKDSQGICFVGDVDIKEFLSQRIKKTPGNIVTPDGKIVGTHRGLAFYTIGQREGVGFSGSVPYYVVGKDMTSNNLVVAPLGAIEHFEKTLRASSLTWVNKAPKEGTEVLVRIRYRQELVKAFITEIASDHMLLEFVDEQRAVTPGQAVVVYRSTEVLGGGVIDEKKYNFTLSEPKSEIEIYS